MSAEEPYIAIVASRFNQDISERLYQGAKHYWQTRLNRYEQSPKTVWVPGAIEIPLVAQKLVKNYDAIVCLGVVINGQTRHFDYVCQQVSMGCQKVMMDSGKPIIFGILTTEDKQQAFARSGGDKGDKGAISMQAAFDMCKVMKLLDKEEKCLVGQP